MISRVDIRGLTYSYPGGDNVITDFSHTFEPGSVTAISGRSGVGKSTLLYTIGLLLTPTRGDIFLDDTEVGHTSDAIRSLWRAKYFGFLFQDAQLDPSRPIIDSVVEPALYAGRDRDCALPDAMALLEQYGVCDLARHRPGEISGGQAQRIALCRALINHPRIIIADEPTGNLDDENGRLVLDSLRELSRTAQTVVIVATHDQRIAKACDERIQL
jgi:putative ABC transport system ATP-binding protein/lipoprotein-releasing system ATP-binding protein